MRPLEEVNAELTKLGADVDAERAAEARELAKQAAAQRERDQIEINHVELIASQRASLARDLNLDVDSTLAALDAKCQATTGDAKRLWAPLFRLWNKLNGEQWRDCGPNPQSAREARHALAQMDLLPPVRRDDLAFSDETALRTALPTTKLDAGSTIVDARWIALLGAMGLTIPREREPGVESPQAARKRLGPRPITLGMAQMLTSDPDERRTAERVRTANDVRARELALIEERYQIVRRDCRAEYERSVVAQRVQIIEAIDRVLVTMPIGEAWWWSRQLRRVAAGEKSVRIVADSAAFDLPIDKVFHLARAAGACFDLTPSTPSKKKK